MKGERLMDRELEIGREVLVHLYGSELFLAKVAGLSDRPVRHSFEGRSFVLREVDRVVLRLDDGSELTVDPTLGGYWFSDPGR
jgi:hypothetical protein